MTCRDKLAIANATIASQQATITDLNEQLATAETTIVAQSEEINSLNASLAECQAGLGSGDYASGYNAGLAVAWAK